MNLMALIEEIDELEEALATTTDSFKRMALISMINTKKHTLSKLNTIKDTHE